MPIPLLQPPLIDDESVIGYLQRMCLVGANGDFKPMVQDVVGQQVSPPLLIPTALGRISNHLASMPSAEDIVNNHTTFKAISAFIPEAKRQNLRRNMVSDEGSRSNMYFALGLTHSKKDTKRSYQSFCEQCAAEDESQHGVGAWRRTHQFPYVMSCGNHGTALRTGSGCCSRSLMHTRTAKLPLLSCDCPNSTVSLRADLEHNEKAVDADARISKLLVQALNWDWSRVVAEDLQQFYRHHIRAKGFTRGLFVDSKRFLQAMENWFSTDLLEAYGSRCLPGLTWAATVAQGAGEAPKSAVRNMLLVDFLFGSLADFQAAYDSGDWRAVPVKRKGVAEVATSKLCPKDHLARTQLMRAQMLDWITQQETATRAAANKQMNRQVLWLRAHDAEWFLKALPPISHANVVKNSLAHWVAKRAQNDLAAAEHLKKRYLQLTADALTPTKLSARSLIGSHFTHKVYGPCTSALLARLVDTAETFRGRRAVWIYSKGPLAGEPELAFQQVYRTTRMSKSSVLDLAASQKFAPLSRLALDEITDAALKASAG